MMQIISKQLYHLRQGVVNFATSRDQKPSTDNQTRSQDLNP
jgi:hypothetical protein